MVIRLRCRRMWVSALLRSLRNQLMPLRIRRHLIVVDQPKVLAFPGSTPVSRGFMAAADRHPPACG
ncbi:hypothetical protein SynWH8103_02667 [Synechococcus sp. WH 8103]|nr:hypothetical protein SynA18461_02708 [Synechococcus sp. A18-46.1]CRY93347.1 hypothetical protein SynWH8103_02667 [Synechococcus sp. WH 8103]